MGLCRGTDQAVTAIVNDEGVISVEEAKGMETELGVVEGILT